MRPQRRDLLALAGVLVILAALTVVILEIHAAFEDHDKGELIAGVWQGYLTAIGIALLPLSWIGGAWWSGRQASQAPTPRPSDGLDDPTVQLPRPVPPGPASDARRLLSRRRVIAVAAVAAVACAVTAVALSLKPPDPHRALAYPPLRTITETTTSPTAATRWPTTTSPRPTTTTTTTELTTHGRPTTSTTRRTTTATATTTPSRRDSTTLSPPPPPVRLALTAPAPGSTLTSRSMIHGTAPDLASGESLWLFLYAPGVHGYYLETYPNPVAVGSDGRWQYEIGLNTSEKGQYVLYAVIVNSTDGATLRNLGATDNPQSLSELPGSVADRRASMTVNCCS